MDRLTWLRHEFDMVCDEVAVMVDAGSYQAAMAGRRIQLQLRKELDDAQEALDEPAEFDPQDLDAVVQEVLRLPDRVFAHPDLQARAKRCR